MNKQMSEFNQTDYDNAADVIQRVRRQELDKGHFDCPWSNLLFGVSTSVFAEFGKNFNRSKFWGACTAEDEIKRLPFEIDTEAMKMYEEDGYGE